MTHEVKKKGKGKKEKEENIMKTCLGEEKEEREMEKKVNKKGEKT